MTTQFTPVPTYADPVDVDEKTHKGHFNPIWLKWFLDVGAALTTVGAGTAGKIQHNDLGGLQGGGTNEEFHLTAAEHTAVQNIGVLGGYQTASVASTSALTLTNSIGLTVTSLALPTGDWDVSGTIGYVADGATVITVMQQGLSSSDNLLGPEGSYSSIVTSLTGPTTNPAHTTPIVRFPTGGTVYLVALAKFTTNTLKAYGTIRARRLA